jgi:hypothetical protein
MRTLPLCLLAMVAFSFTGCVTYEKKWNEAVAAYEAGETQAPAGPWTGTWTTETNGHTGDLRAIVSPSKGGNGDYDFHYHATWKEIFSGAYKVRFPVTQSGSKYLANGEKSLGLFGTFGHKATISGNRFDATYSNRKGDLGTFQMTRP